MRLSSSCRWLLFASEDEAIESLVIAGADIFRLPILLAWLESAIFAVGSWSVSRPLHGYAAAAF